MKKWISRFLVALVLGIVFVPSGLAQDYNFLYYLLPPQSVIRVNDTEIKNTTEKGKMVFQQGQPESLVVGKATAGVKLITKTYQIELRPELTASVQDSFQLTSGSLHLISNPKITEESLIRIDSLELRFKSAELVAFVSGDKSEKIIKVIQGEVEVTNPATKQKTIVKQQQSTNTDKDGLILSPYPFDYNPDESHWWSSSAYQYDYQQLPLAHAGDDQRVLGNIAVVLDGSKSDYKTGDIFEWTLVKGPKDQNGTEIKEVSFDSTNIVKPLFTPTIEGEYVFSLQITNQEGDRSNLDKVTVFVGKRFLRPVAIFPDVPADHPNNLAITYLYKKNVMKGSEDAATGKILFRPDDTINRVEILKTVFENKQVKIPSAEDLLKQTDQIFVDVKPEHWFAPYVYLAKQQGIISGNQGIYRPADPVLLVEALKIVVQANQISLDAFQKSSESPYPDAESSAWYIPYLLFVKKYNLVDTDGKGNINPAQPLTRARFAELLYRMDSINLLEKRGFLSGRLLDEKTGQGIATADVFIYKTITEQPSDQNPTPVPKKGDLYYRTKTNQDGSFSVSLPVLTKYLVEAVKGESASTNKVTTEVDEQKLTRVELKINPAPSTP